MVSVLASGPSFFESWLTNLSSFSSAPMNSLPIPLLPVNGIGLAPFINWFMKPGSFARPVKRSDIKLYSLLFLAYHAAAEARVHDGFAELGRVGKHVTNDLADRGPASAFVFRRKAAGVHIFEEHSGAVSRTGATSRTERLIYIEGVRPGASLGHVLQSVHAACKLGVLRENLGDSHRQHPVLVGELGHLARIYAPIARVHGRLPRSTGSTRSCARKLTRGQVLY